MLPVSFDRTWEENPSFKDSYPIPGADTSLHLTEVGHPDVDYVIPHVKYNDKLMVGYRYWTTTGKHPLFPFGFGLSYATFHFSNLKVPALGVIGTLTPNGISVGFDVTNTGKIAGAEVAQLYVRRRRSDLNASSRGSKRSASLQAKQSTSPSHLTGAPSAIGMKLRMSGRSIPASLSSSSVTQAKTLPCTQI
jgi:hypothetical protein